MKKTALLFTLAHASRYLGQLAVLLGVSIVGTPHAVGNYVLGLAIAGPIFVVAGLGMRTLVLTHKRSYTLRRLVEVRALTSIVAVAVTAAVAFIALPAELRPVVLFVALAKMSDLFLDLATAWWQFRGRVRTLTLLSIGSAVVVASLAVGSALVGFSSETVVMASALGAAGWIVVVVLPVLWRGERGVEADNSSDSGFWSATWDLLRSGFPLGLSYGSVNLLGAVPQYILAAVGSLANVGQFGVLLHIVTAGEVAINPATQAWLTKARQEEDRRGLSIRFVVKESLRFVAVWAPLAAVLLAAGAITIPLVFGEEYSPNAWVIAMIGLILVLMPFVYLGASSLAVRNRYKSALGIVLPALAGSTGLGFALVPQFGIAGAFASYAAASALRAFLPYVVLYIHKETPAPRDDLERD